MFGPEGVEYDAAWPVIEPRLKELYGDRLDALSPDDRRRLCDLLRRGEYDEIERVVAMVKF